MIAVKVAQPTVFLIIVKSAFLFAICLLIFIISIHVLNIPYTTAPFAKSSLPIAKYTALPIKTEKYPLNKPM